MTRRKRQLSIVHSALCIALAACGTAHAATSRLYVQDGLIACWDGIENAGVGVHDPSATVWKDLVAGREFALHNVTVNADRMTFAGAATSYGNLNATDTTATFTAAKNGTMEIVYASRDGTVSQILLQSPDSPGLTFSSWASNGSYYIIPCGNVSNPIFAFSSGTATNSVSVRYTSGAPVSAIGNGSPLTSPSSNQWFTEGSETIIGTRASKKNNHFPGSIYCIRLYSRQLTDAEIAANHAVDDMRFKSGINDSCLEVKGVPIEIGSPSPAYGVTNGLAAGDSFTVSCGQTVWTNESRFVVSSCTGWKLYDVSNTVVSNGVETSFAYTHPTPAAFRTLEWQWEEIESLLPTPSASSPFYVVAPSAPAPEQSILTATLGFDSTFTKRKYGFDFETRLSTRPIATMLLVR